ncbi:MAG: O-antigen ligase family protein [Firmicutes bacterium]|nr:O-antigen ligase family protein [Bacillota bacterium]
MAMDIRSRDARWGLLLPISPAFALVYYGVLLSKIKAVIKGIRSDPVTYWALIALLLSGTVSAALAPNKGQALLNMPIPLVFILIYSLGRWGIVDARDFLKAVTLGCGFLGLVVVVSHLLRLNIWYGSFPILARFNGGRGYVLGMADNGLAAMLEAGVMGGLGFFLYGSRRRWLYLGASLTSLMGIFVTLSRGSMVAACGGILALAMMNAETLKRHWKIVVALCLVVALCITQSPTLQKRILSIPNLTTNRSNIGRLQIWEVSWEMFKDRFLFGSGPGHFGTIYETYRPQGYLEARSPHSLYLFLLTGWGLVGFLLFFGWMAVSVVKPILQDSSPYRRIAFAMMFSFWVHVLFNDLYIAHVPLIMGCIAHPDLGAADYPREESPSAVGKSRSAAVQ